MGRGATMWGSGSSRPNVPMRYLVAILALLAVVGGLAAVKYKQIASLIAANHAMEKAGPPPEAVGSRPGFPLG